MLNQLAMQLDVSKAGEIGLVLFLLIFLGFTAWVVTRSRQDVDHWADIPLGDESIRPVTRSSGAASFPEGNAVAGEGNSH